MKGRSYFPGLHALRFFAATLVIIHHIEQYKTWQGRDSHWGVPTIDHLGHMPVGFFFVLSGFLITYFLLKEMQKTDTVNLRRFYWKRMVRLWPLYFLIVVMALTVAPMAVSGFADHHFDISGMAVLALLFLMPNVLRIIHPNLVGGNQLWSVGVEEQFYIFWPILVGIFYKHIFRFLIGFTIIKLVGQEVLGILSQGMPSLKSIYFLLKLFPVEQMAIGGLGAAALVHRSRILQVLQSRIAFALAAALLIWLFIFEHGWFFRAHLEGLVYLTLITNIIHRPGIYRWLEARWLRDMGDASYGIYMYHTLVIALVMTGMRSLDLSSSVYNVVIYVTVLPLTFGVARLSFIYLERPILQFKDWKWTVGKKAMAVGK